MVYNVQSPPESIVATTTTCTDATFLPALVTFIAPPNGSIQKCVDQVAQEIKRRGGASGPGGAVIADKKGNRKQGKQRKGGRQAPNK